MNNNNNTLTCVQWAHPLSLLKTLCKNNNRELMRGDGGQIHLKMYLEHFIFRNQFTEFHLTISRESSSRFDSLESINDLNCALLRRAGARCH